MLRNLYNFSNVFSRFGDLVLAFLVVCIIGLLVSVGYLEGWL